jgi:hypothetical protein
MPAEHTPPTATDGRNTELWKQIIVTAGVIIVALIGAWQAIRINQSHSAPAPETMAVASPPASPPSTVPAIPAVATGSADSTFVSQYVYRADEIDSVEYVTEGADPPTLSVERIAFGHDDVGPAFSVRLVLKNVTQRPMTLALSRRFFVLEDDHGRAAELTSFCCDATGALLGAGQPRDISLLFRAPRGWFGKTGAPRRLYLRAEGLLPVVRASWSLQPLRTAA